MISELESISKIFGSPRRLITDAGLAFASKSFKKYCGRENIRLYAVDVGMPESNGRAEQFGRAILDMRSWINVDGFKFDSRQLRRVLAT